MPESTEPPGYESVPAITKYDARQLAHRAFSEDHASSFVDWVWRKPCADCEPGLYRAIAIDSDDNVILAPYHFKNGGNALEFFQSLYAEGRMSNIGVSRIWLTKLDNDGNLLWGVDLDRDAAAPVQLTTDSEGNILAGYRLAETEATTRTIVETIVEKYGPNGRSPLPPGNVRIRSANGVGDSGAAMW